MPEDIKRAHRKLARKYHPDVSKEKDADSGIVQATKTYVVKPMGFKMPDGKSGDGNISEFTLKLSCESRL